MMITREHVKTVDESQLVERSRNWGWQDPSEHTLKYWRIYVRPYDHGSDMNGCILMHSTEAQVKAYVHKLKGCAGYRESA